MVIIVWKYFDGKCPQMLADGDWQRYTFVLFDSERWVRKQDIATINSEFVNTVTTNT